MFKQYFLSDSSFEFSHVDITVKAYNMSGNIGKLVIFAKKNIFSTFSFQLLKIFVLPNL